MGFIIILILTTLTLASTAAFFSIYGLAAIFSGIFWPVVIMGSTLEAGKLVAASYVYRFRDSMNKIMKAYLILAIIILMVITSAGIFGFLSMGYQQDSLPLKQQEQQIKLLISEKTELENFKKERLERRKQIDADITSLPNNYVTSRQRLLKSYGPELDRLRDDIRLYTKQISAKTLEISKLKQKKLVSEVHIGPIIFIAKAFSSSTDDATKWMIILIMFAFDPLAVALTLGINHALQQHRKRPPVNKEEIIIDDSEPINAVKDVNNTIEDVNDIVELDKIEEASKDVIEIERIETNVIEDIDVIEDDVDDVKADDVIEEEVDDVKEDVLSAANISIEDSRAVLKPEQRAKLIRQAKIYVKDNLNKNS